MPALGPGAAWRHSVRIATLATSACLTAAASAQPSGSILAWGSDQYGQLNVPAPNSDFIAIAAGYRHSLGLKADGSIIAWGFDLGAVPAPHSGFTAIAAGAFHSLGLKSDGSIVGWNGSGQLDVPAPNSGFVAIAAGGEHSLAIRAQTPVCYPNCDQSAQPPILNVADFGCFLQKFAAGCP